MVMGVFYGSTGKLGCRVVDIIKTDSNNSETTIYCSTYWTTDIEITIQSPMYVYDVVTAL